MGNRAQAKLVYGFPWRGEDVERDKAPEWLHKMEDEQPYSFYLEDYIEEKLDKDKADLYTEERDGADECSAYYLCIDKYTQAANDWRGEKLDEAKMTINGALEYAFENMCKDLGIPWQEPSWWLLPYYG